MTAAIFLGIGLEYIDAVFQTIQNSSFSQYTIAGMKTLAVLFFLVNILKKYNEGIADKDGYSWGLSPGELAKNFAVVLLVIFSTQVLGFFDGILVAIEGQYRGTAPALLPLQLQDLPLEEEAKEYFKGGNLQSLAMALLDLSLKDGDGNQALMELIKIHHKYNPMGQGFSSPAVNRDEFYRTVRMWKLWTEEAKKRSAGDVQ